MDKTPQSLRKCVGIFGDVNSGKSTLFNNILGTDTAIVSKIKGTTTDVVVKSMELIPYGPIVLLDTAGLNDFTTLGQQREEKTLDAIRRCNIALYVIDLNNYCADTMNYMINNFNKYKIPYIIVLSKKDLLSAEDIEKSKKFNGFLISNRDNNSIIKLKEHIGKKLTELEKHNSFLLDGLAKEFQEITLVIPIDSEAPMGRIIAPQVRVIRECLDKNIICHVTTVETLEKTLNTTNTSLVITDSQAFKEVSNIVSSNDGDIPLTSFSILLAKEKGFLDLSLSGVKTLSSLQDNDKILVLESCTHTKNHEDIGTVKIPKLLQKITNTTLDFEFQNGRDFKLDNDYKLIIHCGGCMISTKEVQNRMVSIENKNIPVINYGVFLAYGNGILEESISMFK